MGRINEMKFSKIMNKKTKILLLLLGLLLMMLIIPVFGYAEAKPSCKNYSGAPQVGRENLCNYAKVENFPCICPEGETPSCYIKLVEGQQEWKEYQEVFDCKKTEIEIPAGVVPYKFETGIPGIIKQGEYFDAISLTDLLKKLIRFLFPLAGVLAFAMIFYAGFEYAFSAGNAGKQKQAQERIVSAIIGLGFLFGFWLIIYIINPDILRVTETFTELNQDSIPAQNFEKICKNGEPFSYRVYSDDSDNCIYIKNDVYSALLSLKSKTDNLNIKWTITEACEGITSDPKKPCRTSVYHGESLCHPQGNCIDLIINNYTGLPADQRKEGFIAIANAAGFHVWDEYNQDCWYPETTGGHLHLAYKAGPQQCNPNYNPKGKTGIVCWFCAK